MAYAVGVVLLVLFGVGAALLAVLPPWLGRPLNERFEREQANMRSKSWRDPYFNPDTDPDRFLRQLRLGAAVAALICAGLLIGLLTGR